MEFNVPFNWHQSQMQVPYFTGRIGTMLQLHEALTKDASKTILSPVVLFGPGGVGKTQIALEYINRHRKDYSSTIWIDGTSPESVRRSFTNFASQLLDHYDAHSLSNTSIYRRLTKVFDDPIIGRSQREALPLEVERRDSDAKKAGPRDRNRGVHAESARPSLEFYDHQYITAVEVVLDWLRMAQNKHWLLVYDNFDDIESYDIRDFFPNTQRGCIIVTSRRRECARLGLGIEVEQLGQADALELLKKSAKLTDELDEKGKVSRFSQRIC